MSKTNNKVACPVICETTGKTYRTITNAAKAIGVNAWTMSVKMTSAGRFVDKEGNVYKRVKPMNSKNTYKSSDHITRTITRKAKHTIKEPVVETKVQHEPIHFSFMHNVNKPDTRTVASKVTDFLHSQMTVYLNQKEYDKVKECIEMIDKIK